MADVNPLAIVTEVKSVIKKTPQKKKKTAKGLSERHKAKGELVTDPYDLLSHMGGRAGSSLGAINEVKTVLVDFFDYSNDAATPVVNSVYNWWLDMQQDFLNTADLTTTNSYQNGVRVLSVQLFALPLVAVGQSIAASTYLVKTVFAASALENSAQIIGLSCNTKVMNPNFNQSWIKVASYKVDSLLRSGLFRPYVKSPCDMNIMQIQCVDPDTDTPITGRNIQFRMEITLACVMNPSQSCRFSIKKENTFAAAGTINTVPGRIYCQFKGMSDKF